MPPKVSGRRWTIWRDRYVAGGFTPWSVGDHGDDFYDPTLADPHAAEVVEVMPVGEHDAAMRQVRRFREYERWERVYEAARAVVSRYEGERIDALRAALEER